MSDDTEHCCSGGEWLRLAECTTEAPFRLVQAPSPSTQGSERTQCIAQSLRNQVRAGRIQVDLIPHPRSQSRNRSATSFLALSYLIGTLDD